MNIVGGAVSKNISGYNHTVDYGLSIIENPFTAVAGATLTNQTTVGSDQAFTTVTGATLDNNFIISAGSTGVGGVYSLNVKNLTPTVISLGANGAVTRLADGVATLQISNSNLSLVRHYSRAMARTVSSSQSINTGYAVGSLANHVSTAIDTALTGQAPGSASQDVYSAFNSTGVATGSTATRKTHWASGFTGWEAISFIRDGWGASTACPFILISTRHFLYAAHTNCVAGFVAVWEKAGIFYTGTVQSATVIAGTDIGVGLLTAPITAIAPMQLLPANYASYLPSQKSTRTKIGTIPCITALTNAGQNTPIYTTSHHVRVFDINSLGVPQTLFGSNDSAVWQIPANAQRAAFSATPVGGDSGSPIMLPVNNVLTLVAQIHIPTAAPCLADYITQINAAMTTLLAGNTYTVATANLAAFTVY